MQKTESFVTFKGGFGQIERINERQFNALKQWLFFYNKKDSMFYGCANKDFKSYINALCCEDDKDGNKLYEEEVFYFNDSDYPLIIAALFRNRADERLIGNDRNIKIELFGSYYHVNDEEIAMILFINWYEKQPVDQRSMQGYFSYLNNEYEYEYNILSSERSAIDDQKLIAYAEWAIKQPYDKRSLQEYRDFLLQLPINSKKIVEYKYTHISIINKFGLGCGISAILASGAFFGVNIKMFPTKIESKEFLALTGISIFLLITGLVALIVNSRTIHQCRKINTEINTSTVVLPVAERRK
ncbi:MAG: hypothetical protein OEY79_03375 [Anaplasmataceae bacterium]|nr:hypothetical protein [Anaplasmataceae bacterium]